MDKRMKTMTEKTRQYFERHFWIAYVKRHKTVGPWELLTLPPSDIVPKGVVAFDQIRQGTPRDLHVHFHGWDNLFERMWRQDVEALRMVAQFAGAFPTDFSQFTDFDFSLCLWNLRRNRIVANWLLENEIDVIPSATWWNEASLEHALDGLPRRSLIEVSNVNTRRDERAQRIFDIGLAKVRDLLDPIAIIIYGNPLRKPFDGPPILFYQNSHYTGNGCSYLNQEQLQLMEES